MKTNVIVRGIIQEVDIPQNASDVVKRKIALIKFKERGFSELRLAEVKLLK